MTAPRDTDRATGPETSQTLDRALRLLHLLSESGDRGLTVSEMARALGVGRPVVYRLLATLDRHGWVRRLDDNRMRIGLRVLELVAAAEPALRQVSQPLLRELADQVGATAHLTVAEGDQAVAVTVVEPRSSTFHVAYRVGSRHPIDVGAAGRAILAGRSGDQSVVSTTGELQHGAHGLAAPVLGVPGLEASVGVVTIGAIDESAVAPLVREVATSVGSALRRLG